MNGLQRIPVDPNDPQNHILLRVVEIARGWPGKPSGISPSAVFRLGKRGSGGTKLKLVRVPGVGLCSCFAWVRDFIDACNNRPGPSGPGRRTGRRLLRERLEERVPPASHAGGKCEGISAITDLKSKLGKAVDMRAERA